MKKIIYAALLLTIVGCSEQIKGKKNIVISPLEIMIEEDTTSLTLDVTGLVSQNKKPLGNIKGNSIVDLKGNTVFTMSENYIISDVNNDTVLDCSDKNIALNDSFLGVFRWSKSGALEFEDGDKLNIQIIPNDSTLYRTASLIIHYAEHMKEH